MPEADDLKEKFIMCSSQKEGTPQTMGGHWGRTRLVRRQKECGGRGMARACLVVFVGRKGRVSGGKLSRFRIAWLE